MALLMTRDYAFTNIQLSLPTKIFSDIFTDPVQRYTATSQLVQNKYPLCITLMLLLG